MKLEARWEKLHGVFSFAPHAFLPSYLTLTTSHVTIDMNGLSLFRVGSVKKNGMFAVSVLMQGSIFMTTNSCQYMATISIENYYMTEQQRSNEVVTSKRTNVV